MAVYLAPVGNGWQWFTFAGNVLSGGKIYQYAAGSTSVQGTWNSNTGLVPNANPVILDSTGRYAQEMWFTAGQAYKFQITDATGVIQYTLDNLQGINDLSFGGAISSGQINYTPPGSGAVATTVAAELAQTISVADFGAVGDASADDASAINLAITYAQSIGAGIEFQQGKKYKLGSSLAFKQGKSASDSQSYSVYVKGNNCTLFPEAGVTAISINPRCLLADIGTGRSIAPINMSDLIVDGGIAGGSGAYALLIGAAGYRWGSFSWSGISNFTVQNLVSASAFPTFALLEGRHCVFDRVDLRSGNTCLIQSSTNSSFCGDFVFRSCEFSGSGSQPPITIAAGVGSTTSQTRGIKFISCDIYGGGTYLHATGSGQLGDIWFDGGCQFDNAAGTDPFLTIYADAAGAALYDVHSHGTCFTAGTQAAYIRTANSATMKAIEIAGGYVGSLTVSSAVGNSAIEILNANGVSVHDVQFDQITGDGANSSYVVVDTSTNIMVNNNQAMNATSMPYGVTVANASTKYSIIGNMMNCSSSCLHDVASGGPVKQEANNLQV